MTRSSAPSSRRRSRTTASRRWRHGSWHSRRRSPPAPTCATRGASSARSRSRRSAAMGRCRRLSAMGRASSGCSSSSSLPNTAGACGPCAPAVRCRAGRGGPSAARALRPGAAGVLGHRLPRELGVPRRHPNAGRGDRARCAPQRAVREAPEDVVPARAGAGRGRRDRGSTTGGARPGRSLARGPGRPGLESRHHGLVADLRHARDEGRDLLDEVAVLEVVDDAADPHHAAGRLDLE